jgi:hypothetical protein
MGCSRVRESSCRVAGIVFRTKRTTANEPATIGPRFTPPRLADQTHTTTTPAPRPIRRWRPGGSAPQPPRDLPLLCRARREKQKRDAPCIPSPISAPESALGSRLRVALSSAQVTEHFICAAFAELQPVRAQGPKTPPGPGRSSPLAERFSPVQPGPIRFLGDVPGVEPTGLRASYAILGGRFFDHASFFRSNPPLAEIPRWNRPAARLLSRPAQNQQFFSRAP